MRLGRALPVLSVVVAACGAGAWPGSLQAGLRYRASEHRLRVERVDAGGAAARAGLRTDDVVTAIDGEPIAALDEATIRARLQGEVGTRVVLRVARDGATVDVPVERAPRER